MQHGFVGSYLPTVKADARVFWLVRPLRKSSNDESPQLINVLKSYVSLVGARPHMVERKLQDHVPFEDVEGYIAWHLAKLGITGGSQVNGWRGPAHTLEQIGRRVAHEIYYIEHCLIWLDLVISMKTVFFGSLGENAF